MKQSKRQFQGRETPIRKEGIREGKRRVVGVIRISTMLYFYGKAIMKLITLYNIQKLI